MSILKSEVYFNKPKIFSADIISCACFIVFENNVLLLKKAPGEWSENLWGIPCGKMEKNEDIYVAMIREIYEEIGFKTFKDFLKYLGKTFIIQYDGVHNQMHVFYHILKKACLVTLSNEHSSYSWISKEEINKFQLIPGQKDILDYFSKIKNSSF